ncbi:MAG: uroporphyrinogen-III C-methyltransferase [bacterium]
MNGVCYLIGMGAGDLGMVTLRAKELIERADVIVHDRLINADALAWARADAEIIDVGKSPHNHPLPQDKINALLIRHTRAGKAVARLKGGDPFLFGRGGEEAEALQAVACAFEIVPGVTAALAAAACAGIPLTHRNFASSVTFLTGHEDPLKNLNSVDWRAAAQLSGTLAIYMGMERLAALMDELRAGGLPPERPAAAIQWAGTARQRVVVGQVSSLAALVKEQNISAPAIVIIGEVVRLREKLAWMEKRPLFGKRIVLTRMRRQASRLRGLLEEQGAEVLELPVIKIAPKRPAMSLPLSHFDWLIFASPNAVENFFAWIEQEGDVRDLAGMKVAAIGPATAECVRKRGVRVDFMPQAFTTRGLIESWPHLPCSMTALYPCSNLASNELENALRDKGVSVKRLEVYQTLPEPDDRAGVRKRLEKEGADWIVFASSSAVTNFNALNLRPKDCRYASIGPVTSATMTAFGYPIDLEAEESRVEQLVEGIVKTVV